MMGLIKNRIARTALLLATVCGSQAFGQALVWDSSGNSMLTANQNFYFREVIWTFSSSSYTQYAFFGTIVFSGTGTYTTNATVIEVVTGQGLSGNQTGVNQPGTYSVSAGGLVLMTDPLAGVLGTSGTIRGMVSNGIFIGSATEGGFNHLMIAAQQPASTPTASTFSGTYTIAYQNFSELNGDPYDAQFTLNPNGAGIMSTSNINGFYGGSTGAGAVTQSVGSTKYSASNGAIVLNFPALSNSTTVLSGQEYLYFSQDGNFVFGGSPTQGDLFLGVNTSSTGTLPNNSLFYDAGVYALVDTGGFEDFDTYYGSFSLNNGAAIEHFRTFSGGGGSAFDNINTDTAPTSGGSTYTDGLYNYTIGDSGNVRIGFGQPPYIGIDVAIAAPSFSGSGVYLNPTLIRNAASYAPFTAGISPGELIVINGTGLAPSSSLAMPTFPTKINGVQVLIDGIAAPLYYATPTQIAAVVPYATSQFTLASIQVNNNGSLSKSTTLFLTPGIAGIFTSEQNGIGHVAALHLDYSLVTESSPAQPGETISVYLTGLGTVFPPVSDGAPGSSSTLNNTVNTVTASIDSYTGTQTTASVLYSGLAPGLVGLYQVNITIPTGVTAGDNFLELDVTNSSTGAAVSFAEEAIIPIGSGSATVNVERPKVENSQGQKSAKHGNPRPSQRPVVDGTVQP